MICIKTDIPEELCRIDDELKAIYHSQDTVCIWVFKTRQDRNRFMDETVGMKKLTEKIITLQTIRCDHQFASTSQLMRSRLQQRS